MGVDIVSTGTSRGPDPARELSVGDRTKEDLMSGHHSSFITRTLSPGLVRQHFFVQEPPEPL